MVIILALTFGSSFNIFASDSKALSKDILMNQGQAQYKLCAGCHGMDGEGTHNFAPALSNSSIVNGSIYPLISAVVGGIAQSKDNKWDAYMPAWSGVFSNERLASVITFIRNSLGNSTGDLVQPDTIATVIFIYNAIKQAELPYNVKTCDSSMIDEPIKADNVSVIKIRKSRKYNSKTKGVKYSPVIIVSARVSGICKNIDNKTDGIKEKYKYFISEFEFAIYQSNFKRWTVKEIF